MLTKHQVVVRVCSWPVPCRSALSCQEFEIIPFSFWTEPKCTKISLLQEPLSPMFLVICPCFAKHPSLAAFYHIHRLQKMRSILFSTLLLASIVRGELPVFGSDIMIDQCQPTEMTGSIPRMCCRQRQRLIHVLRMRGIKSYHTLNQVQRRDRGVRYHISLTVRMYFTSLVAVSKGTSVTAPSGDVRDYLSWAP